MYCSKCGSKLVEDAAFCQNCGNHTRKKRNYKAMFAVTLCVIILLEVVAYMNAPLPESLHFYEGAVIENATRYITLIASTIVIGLIVLHYVPDNKKDKS